MACCWNGVPRICLILWKMRPLWLDSSVFILFLPHFLVGSTHVSCCCIDWSESDRKKELSNGKTQSWNNLCWWILCLKCCLALARLFYVSNPIGCMLLKWFSMNSSGFVENKSLMFGFILVSWIAESDRKKDLSDGKHQPMEEFVLVNLMPAMLMVFQGWLF